MSGLAEPEVPSDFENIDTGFEMDAN